jgi:hypothetical protein
MPMYQGFFDGSENQKPSKIVFSIRAADLDQAKKAFETECPEAYRLRSIAEKVEPQGQYAIRYGDKLNSTEYGLYLKNNRDLLPLDAKLDSAESAVEKLKSYTVVEPELDELSKRNPPPSFNSLIQFIGWAILICSVLSLLPALVSGLLLIATAWAIKVLNRIMVVTQYQAELASFQHNQNKILAKEKELQKIKQLSASEIL